MKVITTLCILALLFISTEVSAKNYYRFKNGQGKLVVKDYLPEYAIRNGYDIINHTGRLVERVPAELSPEEKQKQRVIDQELQKRHEAERKKRQKDILLLRQYSNVEAIERSKKSQTSTLNINIRIVNAHSESLKTKLEVQQKRAAEFERQGKKVPDYVLHEISAINNQIAANAQSIARYQGQIDDIEEQFKKDSIRFQELKAEEKFEKSQKIGTIESKSNVHLCESKIACDRAWKFAQVFAQKNASHPLSIVTDSLLVTGKPNTDDEYSITITRLPENNETGSMNIVFDVTCFKSSKGKDKCLSSQVQNLKNEFITYISK